MKKLLNEKVIVLVILILAFFIRLYKIDSQNLWRDEAFSVNASMMNIGEIFSVATNDTQPPLHMLTLHYWGSIFGFSEISVRFVSLIFGIISLVYIYLISKRVFKDRRLIYLTTSIAAFSPLLIFYSQEARAYSMLLAFFTMSFYYFLKIINKDYTNLDLVFFIATCLGGLYTQNIFVIVAGAYGLLWLIKSYEFRIASYELKLKASKEYLLKILATFMIIGIFYLPWFITFVKQYSKISNEGFWLSFSPIKDIFDSLVFFFLGHTYSSNYGLLDFLFVWIIFLVGITTFFIGFYYEARELDPGIKARNHKIYISVYTLLILGLIWLISFKTPFFYIRYIMFAAPLIFILSAKGFQAGLQIKVLRKLTIFCMILFVISLAGFQILNNANNETKSRFGDAIKILDENYDSNGDLVIVPNALSFHAADYYTTILETAFKVQIYNPENNLVYYEGLSTLEVDDYYHSDFQSVNKVWLMQLWESSVPSHLERAGFMNTKKFDVKGVDMSLWER